MLVVQLLQMHGLIIIAILQCNVTVVGDRNAQLDNVHLTLYNEFLTN